MSDEPVPYEAQPPAGDPVLVDTLTALDKDFSGERNFARLTASSLAAFAARHVSDVSVSDAYTKARLALENLIPVLTSAETRTVTEVSRQVAEQTAREMAAQIAQASREKAEAWASVGTE